MVGLLLSVQALTLGAAALAQLPILATTPATPTRDFAAACTALSSKIPQLIPGHHVYNVQNGIFAKGTTFSNGTFDYATPVVDLPELCRFGAYFNTSAKSSVKFEIWMPTTTWNGRFAFVGNGIDAGAVNYPSMGGAVSNYGFAAASDDNGHEESGIFGEWRANNTESQIDFGYRGVHLSTVFSKNILEAFYGKPEKSYKSYWLGCSSGGKQGLKEIQMYPEDYDGVLAGSPAWWSSHLTAWTVLGSILNPTGPGFVNYSDFTQIHNSVISQCDALDGLQDGIIANPALCHIDWTKTGLSAAQQKQAQTFYTNWTKPSGELIFPAFTLGSEEGGLAGIIGPAFPFTLDYFKYQVLNFTSVEAAANFTITNATTLAGYVAIADKTNPGGQTADNYNISPYFKRGGKLIHYVGTADQLIPYGSSLVYHQRVRDTVGPSTDASYHLYPVPGMGHCAGGSRTTDNFGGDPGASGVAPTTMNPSGNAIMALIQWVEHGAAPNTITATGSSGISRPLCPYPKFPKYVSGNSSLASSFKCQ